MLIGGANCKWVKRSKFPWVLVSCVNIEPPAPRRILVEALSNVSQHGKPATPGVKQLLLSGRCETQYESSPVCEALSAPGTAGGCRER